VDNGLRLLSKVLRQVATSQRFTSYGDLKDAFREQLRRAADLGISSTSSTTCSRSSAATSAWCGRSAGAAGPFRLDHEPRPVSKAEARAFFERVTKLGRAKAMRCAVTHRHLRATAARELGRA
jgi:hypothetical protein